MAKNSKGAAENGVRSGYTYRVHPGVGIARAGDSREDFFIGPEAPDWRPAPGSGYKDAAGCVKRQAARFRVYEYGPDGKAIREITGFEAKIDWTVHLANKKAAWFKFVGRYKWTDPVHRVLRNRHIQGGPEFIADPDLRTELIIDPGPRSVAGVRSGPVRFDTGTFQGMPVHLGELRTDERGALLVLGGHGHSGSVRPENPIVTYANNDDWHDDVGDGPVSATVTFPDGSSFVADPAWAIVTPPKFAPALNDIMTLEDLVHDVAVAQGWLPVEEQVEFHRDILPILTRAASYPWVSAISYRGHGAGAMGNFLEPKYLKALRDCSDASKGARQSVFSQLRAPASLVKPGTARKQANNSFMPIAAGDGGEPVEGDPTTWLTLLPSQYECMRRWAEGDFVVGEPSRPRPLELLPAEDQPDALDRGALQPCVGGPFYPGIEMTFIAAEPATWQAPYRIAQGWSAGDVTRWMAVPWQADFFECNTHWWPATRPDDVLPEAEYDSAVETWRPARDRQEDGEDPVTAFPFAAECAAREPWARGLPRESPAGDNAMVEYWSELGFVVPTKAPSGEQVYVERERVAIVGLDAREIFYKLMNIDSFPEVLPKARAFAERALAQARAYQHHPDAPLVLRSFDYSPETFQAHMLEVYRNLVEQVGSYDPATDPTYRSADDVKERIRQLAPFNLADGAWLRNITRVGPFGESRAMLFSVLMDEMGDGEVAQNHCNIYRDMCHSIGFYPPDCTSEEYAYDPVFIDSAFDVPTFELAISQFSDDFYPELIGMTLYLELSVVELKTTIALMEYYGFDPHYWEMHVGIDNPLTGHAAKAIRAIVLYLDNIRANAGGTEAMQEQWRRIWDGWVAFAIYGSFAADFAQHLSNKPSLNDRVLAMIESKAPFGSMNHDANMLGDTYINDWFLDPPGFMKALVKAGLFVPGNPEESPFFELTTFETGRMFRVFTDDELALWADWCRSLDQPPAPPPPKPAPFPDMVRLLDTLRARQTGAAEHQLMMLRAPGSKVEHSVSWWFEQPSRDFLEALAWPENGWVQPGDPDSSPFVTDRLSPAQPMGKAFAGAVPGLGGRTGKDVAIAWIEAGCPVPDASAGPIERLWLASTAAVWQAHPTGQVLGMGTIH
jgi:hypothetical protein